MKRTTILIIAICLVLAAGCAGILLMRGGAAGTENFGFDVDGCVTETLKQGGSVTAEDARIVCECTIKRLTQMQKSDDAAIDEAVEYCVAEYAQQKGL